MRRSTLLAILFFLLLSPHLADLSFAEKDNFKFAEGLTKLKYYSLAEEIFKEILADKALPAEKRQEGELGLCLLQKEAAAFERNILPQLEKFRESEKSFNSFIENYPDHPRVLDGYTFNELAEVIQMKSNLVIRIIEESEDFPAEEKEKIRAEAEKSLGESERIYDQLMNMPQTDEGKIRLKYSTAYNKYLLAKTYRDGTFESKSTFEDAVSLFEDLLWDVEGQIVGYYCNFYLGLCHGELALSDKDVDEYTQAKENFESITELIKGDNFWRDFGAHPVKEMVERAFFRSGALSNRFGKSHDAIKMIDIMKTQFQVIDFYPLPENFWKDSTELGKLLRGESIPESPDELAPFIQQLPEEKKQIIEDKIKSIFQEAVGAGIHKFGSFGLLAILEQAKAFVELDDTDTAFALAKAILNANNPNINRRAQEFISDIIRGGGGGMKLDLEALFAAAKGNLAGEKYVQAIDLFQKVVGGCTKEEEKDRFLGEAWNRIGHSFYRLRQFYEAGMAFSEGAKYRKEEDVAQNSAYRAYRAYGQMYNITKNKEDMSLRNRARQFYIDNFGGGGGLVYEQAMEEKAEGRYDVAIRSFKSVDAKENKYYPAQSQIIDCYRLWGKELLDKKNKKKSDDMLKEGLKTASDFKKKVSSLVTTDPKKLDEIANAKAYTAYYETAIYDLQEDWASIEKILGNFEKEHMEAKAYKAILDPALFLLLKAHVSLDRMDDAEAALQKLQTKNGQSSQSIYGGLILGNKFAELSEKLKGNEQEKEKYLELLTKAADNLFYWVSRVKADFANTFRVGLLYYELKNWERTELLLKNQLYEVYKKPALRKQKKIKTDTWKALLYYLGHHYFLQDKFHDARIYYEELAKPQEKSGLYTVKTKNLNVIMELAVTYGGSVRPTGEGQFQEFMGTENFKPALGLYNYLFRKIRGERRSDTFFNVRFHQALMEYRLRNPDNTKRYIKGTEATSPDLGGDNWKAKFLWLKGKAGF